MPHTIKYSTPAFSNNNSSTGGIFEKCSEFSAHITKAYSSIFCAFEALREVSERLDITNCPSERREIIRYLKDLNDEYSTAVQQWEAYSHEFTAYDFDIEEESS